MRINLTIEAETVEEFDVAVARFARSGGAAADAIMPEIANTDAAKEAVMTKGRKPKAAAPTQNPDGTVIPPVSEPLPQPTPGGTDAPPAESIPPKQEAVDPFAAAGTAGEATVSPAAASPAANETVAATPSAGSPADTAAAANGEITVQQLKDAMADLLKAKSASVAMQVLQEATGCKSLTTGSPNVVEKAKEDPGIMQRALNALIAGKA